MGSIISSLLRLLIGGVSFADQNAKIDRGADVLIATPGRLLDHIERGKLMLHGIEVLVVDEADRMLDMGFIPDIERICKLLPITRQTMFFSATMPPEIKRITNQFLHMPVVVEVSKPASTADTISQTLVKARKSDTDKREDLRTLLNGLKGLKNAIVFANRKRTVGIIEKSMQKHGFNASALHGDMDQQSRLKTLNAFRNDEITFLIASDVAARGLDIPNVSHVINYDVPIHPEDYVHRVGRTGRAGRNGEALMLVTPAEKKAVAAIEKLIEKTIEWQGKAPSDTDSKSEAKSDSGDKKTKGRKNSKPKKVAKKETTEEKSAENSVNSSEEKAAENKSSESKDFENKDFESKDNANKGRAKKGRGRSVYDDVGTVPDSRGFHDGNMPAFLSKPLIVEKAEVSEEVDA